MPTPEVIAVLVGGTITIIGALVAAVKAIRTGKKIDEVAETATAIKANTITVIALVDGRYSEVLQGLADSISSNAVVLQELADLRRVFAELSGLQADKDRATKAQERADHQVEKAAKAQKLADEQAARVLAAKATEGAVDVPSK